MDFWLCVFILGRSSRPSIKIGPRSRASFKVQSECEWTLVFISKFRNYILHIIPSKLVLNYFLYNLKYYQNNCQKLLLMHNYS